MTRLFDVGRRLSDHAIRIQVPAVGWLVLERDTKRAKLYAQDSGADLLPWLEHAELIEVQLRRGMLLRGVQYRKKSSKQSIADRQAWWVEAPPRNTPLYDREAQIKHASAQLQQFYERLRREAEGED